jgi:hypothetical protein
MKYLIPLMLLLLVSCNERYITLHEVSHEEVIQVAEEYTGQDGLDYRGFAIWRGPVCEIWIVYMEEMDEREWMCLLGHEVRHCFEGAWHE